MYLNSPIDQIYRRETIYINAIHNHDLISKIRTIHHSYLFFCGASPSPPVESN